MKRLFFIGIFFILLNLFGLYLLLFTSSGNIFLSNFVENRLNERSEVSFKIEEFVLTFDNFNFKITMDKESFLEMHGDINLFSRNVDIRYVLDIKELSQFTKFTQKKLNGSFNTRGVVKGNVSLIFINGTSNIFNSTSTRYSIVLKYFKPILADFILKGVKINKILYFLDEPIYADGLIDMEGNITDFKMQYLSGEIRTKINKGNINLDIVNKMFKKELKEAISFNGLILTKLEPYKLVSKVDVFTSLFTLFSKRIVLDLRDSSIESDYKCIFTDISKLEDFINFKIKGLLQVDGKIFKKNDVIINGTSNIFKGNINFKLKNKRLDASLNNIEVKNLSNMFYYPNFFDSRLNGNLTYDLISFGGKLDAKLVNGHFLKNNFSSIINKYFNFDVTKEIYDTIELESLLDKETISSVVKMKSKSTSIYMYKSFLDIKKRTINATVKTEIESFVFDTWISGSIDNPKLKVDTRNFFKEDSVKRKKKELIDKISNSSKKKIIKSLKDFFE